MTQNNIDFITAKCGFGIVDKLTGDKGLRKGMDPKEIETFINKSLGVLSSNGVYALWLYLKAENKKENKKGNKEENEEEAIDLVNILEECGIELKADTEVNEKTKKESKIINLSKDLKDLLFAKEVLEKTLIYARYRAKAEASMENEASKKEKSLEEPKEV